MAVLDSFRVNGTDYDLRDSKAVRFDAQTLTNEQKVAARGNIGAASTNDVNGVIENSVHVNDAQNLTEAQKAQARENIGAMTGAVRYDAAQELTNEQKATSRANIDAVAINQGVENAGKALVVGEDGNVTTGDAGISDDVKTALLDIFDHVAYADGDGKQYIDALYNALYGIQPEPTSDIMLDNGTKTFSDGTVVTVNNNHVTVLLGSSTDGRAINLSNLSKNTNDVTDTANINDTTSRLVNIGAGKTLEYRVYNAKSDNITWYTKSGWPNTYDVSTNIRGTDGKSILPAMNLYPANSTPGQAKVTTVTEQLTAENATIGTCAILYIAHNYPAGTKIELDVAINVKTATSGIMLDNGTKTFSDGSVVTINNNHVTVALGAANGLKYVNLSDLSKNTNDILSTSNISDTTDRFVTIGAGETLTYTVQNASSDNSAWGSNTSHTYDVSTNIRGTDGKSILPAMHLYPANSTPGQAKVTIATGTYTAESDKVGVFVLLYIADDYPAHTTIEFDVDIRKV